MILKRILYLLGIIAIIEGFYRLLHPPQLITSIDQAEDLVQKAMDLTLINMGMVIIGGLLVLIALFIKR